MNAVDEVIENMIRAAARQNKLAAAPLQLKKSTALVEDLGFTSWTLVTLFADLEEVFGVDPLNDDSVMMTDIRTVGDLCAIYQECLSRTSSAA